MFIWRIGRGVLVLTLLLLVTAALMAQDPNGASRGQAVDEPDSITTQTVNIGGQAVRYRAVAGTLTVGSTNEIDALIGRDGRWLPNSGVKQPASDDPNAPATARIFYAAYFRTDRSATPRPIMFLYNGGPSTASLWLHMGAFGPRRVAISDSQHQSGAPYPIVENKASLLDVCDLVFIDAPGTGFSRVMGQNAQRAFWGVDQDAHAFERFIRRFITKYDLWNHPKYLFGESYGTTRTAVLAAALQAIDLNGIVLMSSIFNFDDSIDSARGNPGIDQPYALALPSYAAAAYYHHKLTPQPKSLKPFLAEAEEFAMGEYMTAMLKGSRLTPAEKQAIAEKLHHYTSLPADLFMRYNLRVEVGVFDKNLLRADGLVAGRLDSRYSGFDVDPGSEVNDPRLDPMGAATGPAYMAAVNQYLTEDLKFGANDAYKFMLYDIPGFRWDWQHQGPGSPAALFAYTGTSVSLDLAFAMKRNPKMKILLTGGYFDLGTPYFQGIYEMQHLPIPDALQSNIQYRYYETGHMIYLNPDALQQLHDDVAAFVRETEVPK